MTFGPSTAFACASCGAHAVAVIDKGRVLPVDAAAELATRLGLPPELIFGDHWAGATSTVVRWGDDWTVKIPHPDDAAVRACLLHAEVCSVAGHLGVLVPEILAVEDLGALHEVPLIVSRFLPGERLAPGDAPSGVWADVGAQLALLHGASAEIMPAGLRRFSQSAAVDPTHITERLRATGRVGPETARRLRQLIDDIADLVLPDDHPVLCHGDIHAENVIADGGRYVGLVDFAGAGWLDSAWDFVGVPIAAVSPMLDGYGRDHARIDSLPARIAWCRLQTALQRISLAVHPGDDALRAITEADQLLW